MRRYCSEHAEPARSLQLVLLALKTAEEKFHSPTALRNRERYQCRVKFYTKDWPQLPNRVYELTILCYCVCCEIFLFL